MTILVTNSTLHGERTYNVETLGEHQAIRAPEGDCAGKAYGILGYLDPSATSSLNVGGQVVFRNIRTQEEIPFKDIETVLESEPRAGLRIVSRLLTVDYNFFPLGKSDSELLITSPLKEIKG